MVSAILIRWARGAMYTRGLSRPNVFDVASLPLFFGFFFVVFDKSRPFLLAVVSLASGRFNSNLTSAII